MIQLRSSQGDGIEQMREHMRAGKRSGVLVAPCGFGKSVVAAAFIEAAQKKNSKVWFAVDRQILVSDMSAKLFQFGIEHGTIMAGHWNWKPHLRTQVVSIQTIEKRGWDADIDLLIVDEAHANMRKSLVDFVKRSARTRVIGATATPFHPGMGEIYEYVVNPTTTNRQIDEGFLVPLKIFSCVEADMAGAKTVAGEWSDDEVVERGATIVGDIVSTWHEKTIALFGKPEKTIVFSANVAHGAEIVRSFNEAGFNFRQISYKDTDTDERDALIREFRKPDSAIHGLVSCGVLTRGFDVTDVRIGIMARPLRKSFSEFIQQVGRIQRAHEGKSFGVLLDHAGNVGRFGEEMAELFEQGVKDLTNSPDAKPPRKEPTPEEKAKTFCPECGYQRPPRAMMCLSCGYQWLPQSGVETVPGELREVLLGKSRVDISKYAESQTHLWQQCVGYARNFAAPEKQQGRAAGIFKDITGAWPPRAWQVIDTEPAQPGRALLNKVKSRAIAFAKGRQRATA